MPRKQLYHPVQATNPVATAMSCFYMMYQIDGLVQGCSISTADALGILQPCSKPSKFSCQFS